MGSWGRLVAFCVTTPFIFISLTSGSVMANPIASPFDYVVEIAFVNFPINGWLLLAVYFLFKKLKNRPIAISAKIHFILFLAGVGIITFIGAIVDGAAYSTDSISVYVVATIMIGLIAAIVAHRYIRMEFKDSLFVGAIFFVINLAAWSFLMNGGLIDIAWFYTNLVWAMYISFFAALIILSIAQRRRPVTDRVHRLDPWSSTDPNYQMTDVFAQRKSPLLRLVLESTILCFVCFLLMYFSVRMAYG